jgi:hypothetical protein
MAFLPWRGKARARRSVARTIVVILPRDSGEGWWKGRGPRRLFCDDSEAPSQTPPPPSSALRATDGPPPPLAWGRMQARTARTEKQSHAQKRGRTDAEGMAGAA